MFLPRMCHTQWSQLRLGQEILTIFAACEKGSWQRISAIDNWLRTHFALWPDNVQKDSSDSIPSLVYRFKKHSHNCDCESGTPLSLVAPPCLLWQVYHRSSYGKKMSMKNQWIAFTETVLHAFVWGESHGQPVGRVGRCGTKMPGWSSTTAQRQKRSSLSGTNR